MKILFALILFTLANTAMSDTAWFYDTGRSGEGVIVTTTEDGRLAFAFFTHVGSAVPVPPVVSPTPPEPTQSMCKSSTIWFTGIGVYVDDAAIGELRFDIPITEYPQSRSGRVSESITVGTFLVEKTNTGYRMVLETNHTIPNISVFNRVYEFQTLLTE